jgi:hypothetical protein
MISVSELAQLRFGMSEPPQPGGPPGDCEESSVNGFWNAFSFAISLIAIPKGRKRGENSRTRSCCSMTSRLGTSQSPTWKPWSSGMGYWSNTEGTDTG